VVIIDPGAEPETIINAINEIGAKPIAILLTHAHFDHTMKLGTVKRKFRVPLMYNKKEFDSGIYSQKMADKWLKEGDAIKIGEITLYVLETPGHSPGSLIFYSKDVKEYNGKKIDGVIFTGDLLFRGSIGRTDLQGGSSELLFSSIKNKIMRNPELSDNFLVLPGHMGNTSIRIERESNYFKEYFL
jgi:glyoxylase-like metal-dependent hydrolase (beta-lactamase superfamily II)